VSILAEKRFGKRGAQVFHLTYGRARLAVGKWGSMVYEDSW